jgi:hypothetical protein
VQRSDVLGRGPGRRQPRGLRLEQSAHVEELVALLGRLRPDVGTLPGAQLHPSGAAEAVQRCTHGVPADAQPFRQVPLGQPLPGSQRPLDDETLERVVHLVAQRGRLLQGDDRVSFGHLPTA